MFDGSFIAWCDVVWPGLAWSGPARLGSPRCVTVRILWLGLGRRHITALIQHRFVDEIKSEKNL